MWPRLMVLAIGALAVVATPLMRRHGQGYCMRVFHFRTRRSWPCPESGLAVFSLYRSKYCRAGWIVSDRICMATCYAEVRCS